MNTEKESLANHMKQLIDQAFDAGFKVGHKLALDECIEIIKSTPINDDISPEIFC